MARRIVRPAALLITRPAIRLGVSADAATAVTWFTGIVAAVAISFPGLASAIVGVVLLQLWYLLDHVDGQIARYHGRASLDGTALDYLMHHTIHLTVPLAIGIGLMRGRLAAIDSADAVADVLPLALLDLLIGLAAGLLLMMLTLVHDVRYKAFITRLKRVHGRLQVEGGGGGRPEAQPALPRNPIKLFARLLRKICEMHVLMNVLTVMLPVAYLFPTWGIPTLRWSLAALAVTAALLFAKTILRDLHRRAAEEEFARWFQSPEGQTLIKREGWWYVESDDED